MKTKGRKPTTGKFATRDELEQSVIFYYRKTGQHQAQVARTCGVSEGVVARILEAQKK